jgi:hypothetical protein
MVGAPKSDSGVAVPRSLSTSLLAEVMVRRGCVPVLTEICRGFARIAVNIASAFWASGSHAIIVEAILPTTSVPLELPLLVVAIS